MASSPPEFLRLTGQNAFARRLVLSTLTGRPVHISKIRSSSPTNPGLAPHEVTFLRLLESVTNGSSVQISYSGATVTYHPGLITGSVAGLGASSDGDVIVQNIPSSCTRGVTYFLVPIALLAPFSKAHLNIRLQGPGVITSATEAGDISIDTFRTAILPLFGLFGIAPIRIELRVLRRSCSGGGGVVEMRFASQVRLPKTLHLNRPPGRVRRIRGVAYCTGISTTNNARMIYSAREVINPLVSDIHIAAQYDQANWVENENGAKVKTGVGFGLSLVAETSSQGVIYSADITAPASGGAVPEDIGRQAAYQLLEAIEQDVGRLRIGREVLQSDEVVGLARDLRSFGCNAWGLRHVNDEEETDMLVSVKGSGVGNVGKRIA